MTITMMESRSLRIPMRWHVLTEWLPQGSIAMSPIKILFAFAAMMSLLMVFAIQRLPGEERIEVPSVDLDQPAKKSDPLFSLAPPKVEPVRIVDTSKLITAAPKPVLTERVVPNAPVTEPPVALQGGEERPAVGRRAERKRDVCARHKLRKVITNGGRSWRCRR